MAAETKQCPWCAEEILAAARKCKHCGEYLDVPTAPQTSQAVRCERCFAALRTAADLDQHYAKVHRISPPLSTTPVREVASRAVTPSRNADRANKVVVAIGRSPRHLDREIRRVVAKLNKDGWKVISITRGNYSPQTGERTARATITAERV